MTKQDHTIWVSIALVIIIGIALVNSSSELFAVSSKNKDCQIISGSKANPDIILFFEKNYSTDHLSSDLSDGLIKNRASWALATMKQYAPFKDKKLAAYFETYEGACNITYRWKDVIVVPQSKAILYYGGVAYPGAKARNSTTRWGISTYKDNPGVIQLKTDVRDSYILMHEIGHTFGLGHDCKLGNTFMTICPVGKPGPYKMYNPAQIGIINTFYKNGTIPFQEPCEMWMC